MIKELTGNENTFDFRIYFSSVFKEKKGFDVVIGNPPYVRQEQIKEFKTVLKSQYECYTGTADLYVFFYEKGIKILREGGVLAYISSNKYFRAAYGKKLRTFLKNETRLHNVIDFGDAPVFEAIAYPTIVMTERKSSNHSSTEEERQFQALVWEDGQPLTGFDDTVAAKSFVMPQKALAEIGWQFIDAASLNLLERLKKAGTPLGEYVDNRFYYGIKTGFNKAFLVDRETRDQLIAEHTSSAEVLKPFLRGRDVKRWQPACSDWWLLFIPWHFPIHQDETIKGASQEAETAFRNQYPAVYNHLLQFKDSLETRNKSETGIRYEWYALQRCAASYWREFDQSKIIYPDIAKKCEFSFEKGSAYLDCTLFMIPEGSLYLLGILNSSLIQFFFSMISPRVRGDFMRFKSIYVEKIPIFKPSIEQKKAVEILVGYILYLTEQLKNTPSHGRALDVSSRDKLMSRYFEQVLDAVVLELYLPETIHSYGKHFLSHLIENELPNINVIDNDKMLTLRSVFNKLHHKEHPVRIGTFFLDSIPEVRIIRGLE